MLDHNRKQSASPKRVTAQFKTILATWMRVYKETFKLPDGEALTKEKIASYELLLDDIPPEILEAGMRMCAKESGRVFYPTPGEIRAAGEAYQRQQERSAWELQQREERRRLDVVKGERFQLGAGDPDAERERLAAEFREMLGQSKLKAIPGGKPA